VESRLEKVIWKVYWWFENASYSKGNW